MAISPNRHPQTLTDSTTVTRTSPTDAARRTSDVAHTPVSDPIHSPFMQGHHPMSEKPASTQLPIRVSLRFGVRSDNTLVQRLRTIPPYQRPKFLRDMLMEAWNARRPPLRDSTAQKTLASDN